jgi:hypothetical protein
VYSLGASPEAKFSPLCSKRESWTGFKIGDVENNVAARGYHDSVHVANVPLSANRLSVYWPANRLAKPSVWKIWGKRFDTDASGGAAKDDLLRRNVRLHKHLAESGEMVSNNMIIVLCSTYFSSFSFPRTSSTNSGILTTLNSS